MSFQNFKMERTVPCPRIFYNWCAVSSLGNKFDFPPINGEDAVQ